MEHGPAMWRIDFLFVIKINNCLLDVEQGYEAYDLF